MQNNIYGLGLESSCDETSASVVRSGTEVLSNIISSQIDIHKAFNGVVPEVASRAHLEIINQVVDDALCEAGIHFSDLSYISCANRPGLTGSLMISLQTAKSFSYALGIPMIAVSHIESHLYAPYLCGNKPVFPFLGLMISGGNTALYIVHDFGNMHLL